MTTATRTRTGETFTADEIASVRRDWSAQRADAHRQFRQATVRRMGLPYFPTAKHPHTAVDHDSLYLAQCDAWDAMNPVPVLATD